MKKQSKAKGKKLLLSVDKVRELSKQDADQVAGGACNLTGGWSVCTRSTSPLM
jgi:hypothetical protein